MIGITAVGEIQHNARAAARNGADIDDCPYPPGSEQAQRWQLYFHAEQLEIRAEIEA